MSDTVANLIERAFIKAYANETITDYRGYPFVVRRVTVYSDMDGLHVQLYDRNGDNVDYLRDRMAYDPTKENRSLALSNTDALPSIVNLAWDRKAKVWTPILSRYEREDKPDLLNLP